MDQQGGEDDAWIVQLVVAAAGGPRLLDGLVEAPDEAEGDRIDTTPNSQPIVAWVYSKPVFELCDCELRLSIGEQRCTECDPSLGIARILFDCLFEEFDTPGFLA